MLEISKITHQDYEKISDCCMWLSSDYILKFNVELNKHNDKYGKDNYHKEFGYINNGEYRVNISRDFNYYLSIESIKKSINGPRLQLRIGINDIYFLKYKLHEVISWFTSQEHKSLFVKKQGKIIIPVKVEPIKINISFGNYIEFEPSTYTLPNQDQVIGTRIYLNSDGTSFFMDINKLLSLTYFIDTFNMYQSAQLMLNYLSRPENGTNYFGYEDDYQIKQQSQGFFNRVKAVQEN